MLEFLDVAKVYRGGVRGVDGVTRRLGTGLVGLRGPNGAGKSSLMRIAATVTRPTSGQVLFDGTDAVARPGLLRRNLGHLPQDFGVYPQPDRGRVPVLPRRREGHAGQGRAQADRRAAGTVRPGRRG